MTIKELRQAISEYDDKTKVLIQIGPELTLSFISPKQIRKTGEVVAVLTPGRRA